MFRPALGHCEGPSNTCKQKCIKIQYYMYRKVTDTCKKTSKLCFYARLLSFLLQSPYQFTPRINWRPVIFGLTPFEWFISIYLSHFFL
jgi:hypothetical protein